MEIKKALINSIVIILLAGNNAVLFSQECSCTVLQVQNNAVTPCDRIIGNTIIVELGQDLRTVIRTVNDQGGNATILLADGIHQVISTSGFPYLTSDNVVIRSLSGNRDAVTLEGEGMRSNPEVENGILISGNNVTIADLTIRSVGNHGIQVSGHHLFLHNVHIQDTYEQMIKGSTTAVSIDSAIVQCCLLEYTAGVGPNFYIGGLDIHKGRDWIVRDNIIRNIASPAGSLAEHAIHFWNGSRDNTIERNMIFNCDRGIGFGLGSNGEQNDGGLIKNNMIYNDGTALFDDVGIGLENSPYTRIYNNTIFIEYPNAIEYRFSATTEVHIANNLTNKTIRSRNGGTGIVQMNVENAEPTWFKDLTNGDLRLASAPPSLVDQGLTLNKYVALDIDQNARPSGTAYDVGAHELLETSSTEFPKLETIYVYPNPCSSTVHVTTTSNSTIQSISLLSLDGRKTELYKTISKNGFDLNLDQLTSGIYMLIFEYHNKVLATKRLVVAK